MGCACACSRGAAAHRERGGVCMRGDAQPCTCTGGACSRTAAAHREQGGAERGGEQREGRGARVAEGEGRLQPLEGARQPLGVRQQRRERQLELREPLLGRAAAHGAQLDVEVAGDGAEAGGAAAEAGGHGVGGRGVLGEPVVHLRAHARCTRRARERMHARAHTRTHGVCTREPVAPRHLRRRGQACICTHGCTRRSMPCTRPSMPCTRTGISHGEGVAALASTPAE